MEKYHNNLLISNTYDILEVEAEITVTDAEAEETIQERHRITAVASIHQRQLHY